jgi:hypothetical protein
VLLKKIERQEQVAKRLPYLRDVLSGRLSQLFLFVRQRK